MNTTKAWQANIWPAAKLYTSLAIILLSWISISETAQAQVNEFVSRSTSVSDHRFFPDPSDGVEFGLSVLPVTDHLNSRIPAFFGDIAIYVTEIGGELTLIARKIGRRDPIWKIKLDKSLNPVGQHIVLSDDGPIYLVGGDRILAFDWNLTTPETAPGQPRRIQIDNIRANPTQPPVAGKGGNLFYVQEDEVIALNLNPVRLEVLWRAELKSNSTSAPILGPDDRFLYLTDSKSGLVAIAVSTGKMTSEPIEEDNGAISAADKPMLHSPVAIGLDDGTERIYVTANAVNSGVFAVFENLARSTVGTANPKPELSQAWATNDANVDQCALWGPVLSGPFPGKTTPIATMDEYVRGIYKPSTAARGKCAGGRPDSGGVFNGALNADCMKITSMDNSECVNFTSSDNDKEFRLVETMSVIDSAGIILAKVKGARSLFALDTKQGTDGKKIAVREFTEADLADESGLSFGGDGTLYATDASNITNSNFSALTPSIKTKNLAGQSIYSPNHVLLANTTTENTTVAVAGVIFLGTGTKLRAGTRLIAGKTAKP